MLHNAHQPSYWPIDFDTMYENAPQSTATTGDIIDSCIKYTDLLVEMTPGLEAVAAECANRFIGELNF